MLVTQPPSHLFFAVLLSCVHVIIIYIIALHPSFSDLLKVAIVVHEGHAETSSVWLGARYFSIPVSTLK